jgi:transposase
MTRREIKGKEIAKNAPIIFDGDCWIVPSSVGKSEYQVNLHNQTCTCPDFSKNLVKCKHQYAVDEKINREFKTVSANNNGAKKPKRIQTKRNWSGYNKAETKGRTKFVELLSEICGQISEPPAKKGRGRKNLPIRDLIFCLLLKIYETHNSRKTLDYLNDLQKSDKISHVPHFNSISNYLRRDWVTPILSELVTVSSLPLAAIEKSFSVDSSGFGVSGKKTWRDVKYGNDEEWHEWVKAHIICGNLTKIIIAAKISPAYAGDSPFLVSLIGKTAGHFKLEEVMADAAYSSRDNLELIEGHNARALVAFKSNAVFGANGKMWDKLLNFYKYHFDEFHERYRFRNNVETAFSAIKANFGEKLRSRSERGQINELLAKIVCHNLRVLVKSVHELNLEINLQNLTNIKIIPNRSVPLIPTETPATH